MKSLNYLEPKFSQQLSKTYNVPNLTKGNYSVKASYVPIIPR